MKSKHLFIEQIVQSCITRYRGKEAFSNLQKYLVKTPIEIDFSNCETVSLSFLDELISRISQSFELNKVVFRVPNQLVEDKLAHISRFRNVAIYCRTSNDSVHRVIPQSPTLEKATFLSSKVLLSVQ